MTDRPIDKKQGAAAARKARAELRRRREEAGLEQQQAASGPGPDVGELVVPPPGPDEHGDEGADDGSDEQAEPEVHDQGSTPDHPHSAGTGPQDHGQQGEDDTEDDPEQHGSKYAHLEAALVTLGCNVDKLRSGPEFQAWLRQCRCFHRYSFRNRILIWAQDPEATMVAGYRAWQKLSRQVRRGERGLRILAPVDRKDDDGERVVYGFKLATVFDVAQTDGDELTAPPSWPETDSCPEGLLDDLMHRAWHEGISIRLVNDPAAEGHGAGTRGWYEHTGKEITLVSTYGEPELVATFLHELAHHYDHDRWDGRRAGELVAESAAYLAGGELGVGIAKEAEAYTANWATCGADVLALADRSLAAAEAILDLVRPQEVAA